jgi:gentisate 1,2-dioxygenase
MSSSAEALSRPGTGTHAWNRRARFFNSGNAFAHVHNAMALTLCLAGEGCHSLVDGERKDWSRYAVMVTPPGAAHSHHNEGSTRMESWVVQDGGLHYHARTTGFAYAD